MMRAVMESASLTLWPILSLILFALFTLALGFWLYRRGSKPYYEKMAAMAVDRTDGPDNADLVDSLEGRR